MLPYSFQDFGDYVDAKLEEFRPVFPRSATYCNFKTLVYTGMSCPNHHGVTDSARMLCSGLDKKDGDRFYEKNIKMLRRTDGYSQEDLSEKLCEIIRDSGYVYKRKVNGVERTYIITDGHVAVRSGHYMPAVKKTVQNSESPSKPQHTTAHMWGVAGVLVGDKEMGINSLPVTGEIQQGEKEIRKWRGDEEAANLSHIERMVGTTSELTEIFGHSFMLADTYFFTTKAYRKLKEHNAAHPDRTIIMISRAKKNARAWTPPPEKEKGSRGRPRVRGERVYLADLFETEKKSFKKETMYLYGKEEEVSYLEKVLLWGEDYVPVKFILASTSIGEIIFVCTDIEIDARTIIEGYAFRWKCEVSFKIASQDTNAFDSHFWTKHMPRFNRYAKKTDPDPMTLVEDEEDREKIWRAFRAYERYAVIAFISQALLQLLAFDLAKQGYISPTWLRTTKKGAVSIETLIQDIFRVFLFSLDAVREKLKPDKNKKDSSAIII